MRSGRLIGHSRPRGWSRWLCIVSVVVSGCGFHPIAMSQKGQSVRPLSAIVVAIIPERAGQLLRQALQARIDSGAREQPNRFELRATLALNADALAIEPDSTITRERVVGVANYSLVSLDTGKTLTSGTARSVDGLDVINQQYFAADLAYDSVVRRIAEGLADQVVLQLQLKLSGVATR